MAHGQVVLFGVSPPLVAQCAVNKKREKRSAKDEGRNPEQEKGVVRCARVHAARLRKLGVVCGPWRRLRSCVIILCVRRVRACARAAALVLVLTAARNDTCASSRWLQAEQTGACEEFTPPFVRLGADADAQWWLSLNSRTPLFL